METLNKILKFLKNNLLIIIAAIGAVLLAVAEFALGKKGKLGGAINERETAGDQAVKDSAQKLDKEAVEHGAEIVKETTKIKKATSESAAIVDQYEKGKTQIDESAKGGDINEDKATEDFVRRHNRN